MDKYFGDKIVWITGASSGIGEALVYAFAEMGSKIIASSVDQAGLELVIKKCNGMPGSIRGVVFDLSDSDSIADLAKGIIAEEGHIDILINIGGVSQRATITDTPLWLDKKIMNINYFGTIALTKAVLPEMVRNGGGQIAATSSINGRFGFPLRSAYSASKQALHGFFETLMIEHAKDNIKVSVLIPGRVKTNISIHALTSSGKEHGVMDHGQESGISTEKAAKIIIRGLRKNKREILVGSTELLMLKIRKYTPSLFFWIAGRIKSM